MSSFRGRVFATHFVLAVIICSLIGLGESQQFYPNGRYGRRSSMPALADIASGREMSIVFFGDASVQCVFTGYQDYYKCNRKVENRPLPSPAVD